MQHKKALYNISRRGHCKCPFLPMPAGAHGYYDVCY